jgi:two-component system cell cycle sensor histidine kinase/response regulator CckA
MMSNAAKRASMHTAAPSLEVSVAHDFKNLLFVITAHCHRLIQTLAPEDARRRDAEAIAIAADRAVTLTRQILDTGRAAPAMTRSIDLNLLLGDLQPLLKGVIGERVSLAWSLTESLWTLHGNPTQVEQIVVNLAANARDAMPDGGTLTISTENRVANDGFRQRDWVVLTVRDSGQGMTPDVKARMFDPYFTTKGDEGTGVGLATVHAIVTASGGYVEVDTAPGEGTAISIVMPREATVVVKPAPPVVTPMRPQRLRSVKPRVLLVDDEPAVRDLLAHCLEIDGYEAVVASSGQEALDILHRSNSTIDAVVTDLNLPDIHGAEVLKESHRLMPGSGILAISGAATDQLAEVGAPTPLLMKPFSLADFKRAVRAAVGERRLS